ncbi:MAG: alpha/beta hydrolase [Proteobacteria bacterium]|nr:alpha/beta hydrolase [Pseudomonadota bacterium]
MPYLTMRDGGRVFVRIMGQGKPVVLLHGFAMHSAHWLPFIWPYSRTHRFIMPDFRGFGRSHRTRFNQECVLTNYSQDVTDIVRDLGLDEFTLGGISMGAYTCMHHLGRHPDAPVEKCLLIDQSPQAMNDADWPHGLFGPDQEARLEPVRRLLAEARTFGPEVGFGDAPKAFRRKVGRVMGQFVATALYRPYQKTLARLAFGVEPLAVRILPADNWRAYMAIIEAYLSQDYDMRPHVPGFSPPITVMAAVSSEMYPCQGQFYISDHAPSARLVRFHKSGHAIPFNEPVKFARELGRFLGS